MRGARIALIAAIGGMLLVPASPLADEPAAPPTAVLDGPSASVVAGTPLKLDSSRSTPGSGAIVGHVWDLDGNGSFETDTGTQTTAEATPKEAGPLTVQVRVLDDRGQSADAKLDLAVSPAPAPANADGTNAAGPGIDLATSATPAGTSATVALVPPKDLRQSTATKKRPTRAHRTATVSAAASSGVTIKNFKFSPGTSSVHVGDTITWTNKDIAPHTATATDGSFNTGTINKDKSGSHTFTKAGTFPYICSIHPSMKASVTVLASSSGSGSNSSGGTSSGSNSSGSSTPSSSSTASSSSNSSLPHTGLDISVIVLIAMCMTGSGASLRRALR